MFYTITNICRVNFLFPRTKLEEYVRELDYKYTKGFPFLVTSVIANPTTNFSSIFAKKSKKEIKIVILIKIKTNSNCLCFGENWTKL